MEKISLESVDKVKERTGVSYSKAKEALEFSGGDVLDAIIFIENQNNNNYTEETEESNGQSIEEFKIWLRELIRKGNVARIKIKKDDNVLADVPVNAGIAVSVIAIIMPSVLAFGVIAAVATKITIEITKVDGSVEIVNKYVSKAADEVKEKANEFADAVKNKFNEVKEDVSNKKSSKEQKVYTGDETVYSYTVNFEDDKDNEKTEK
jgi:signal transduction protein with GAF and PtsI domain